MSTTIVINDSDLIRLILGTPHFGKIQENLVELRVSERDLVKRIHPDVCKDPQALDCFQHFNSLKDRWINGCQCVDDAGKVTYWPDSFLIEGDAQALQRSLKNYRWLTTFNNPHFQKYLPQDLALESSTQLRGTLINRAVPLTDLAPLGFEHLRWVLSRLLELIAWLESAKIYHAGLTPASVFVVPETHGIICTSFYHLNSMNQPLNTISGRFLKFYPKQIFKEKIGSSQLDLEMAKRTVAWAGGDETGTGVKLRKIVHPDWLAFLQKVEVGSAYQCLQTYRELIESKFKRKFYPLNA